MIAYQVFKGENDKHDRQMWELEATYTSKDRAQQHADKIVSETKLYGSALVDEGWKHNDSYRVYYAHGWDYVGICKIEAIEIITD